MFVVENRVGGKLPLPPKASHGITIQERCCKLDSSTLGLSIVCRTHIALIIFYDVGGVFRLQKISENFYWEFLCGKSAFHMSQVPFEGAEGGLAAEKTAKGVELVTDKDEKSVNRTQIFHWEVSTEKTRLPFQEFRLFRKISRGTNQNVVFHLHPNRNFQNFW